MSMLSIAKVPAVVVQHDVQILTAVRLMVEERVGAVVVLKGEELAGIFTERDLMTRVVMSQKDVTKTPVSEVMTSNVEAVKNNVSHGEALRMMVERHFRHLPVVDDSGRVLGMVSVRDLLRHRVEDLSTQLDSVVNYFTADGIGG